MTEIENKMKWSGEEYSFATTDVPEEDSPSFATGEALYRLYLDIADFAGKKVLTSVKDTTDIPNGSAVYNAMYNTLNRLCTLLVNAGVITAANKTDILDRIDS